MEFPEPSYITVEEVKANALIPVPTGMQDGDITKLIQMAEGQIDKHVGRQPHHPNDDNIDRVFPRAQDYVRSSGGGDPDSPDIPLCVSEACLRQVESLFGWWPNRASMPLPTYQLVYQRAIGADGSYSETRARGGVSSATETALCEAARAALDGLVSRWAGIDVTDVDTIPSAR